MQNKDVSGNTDRQRIKKHILIGWFLLVLGVILAVSFPEESTARFAGIAAVWVGAFCLGTAKLMAYWYYK